jgi:predicted HicB family RNase H-like nuclease
MATTTIRLPDDLHNQIRREAFENGESMNAWIIRALENQANKDGESKEE